MKRTMLAAILVLSAALSLAGAAEKASSGSAAPFDGAWEGAIVVMGVELGIRVDLSSGGSGPAGTIDIPQQGAQGLPLENVRFETAKLHFELAAGPGTAVFDGEIKDGAISGTFLQGPAKGTFRLERPKPAPAAVAAKKDEPPPYKEEEIKFETEDGVFAGTLTVPPGTGPHPAVVLITGSGPQNRDEEIFGFRPFRLLADHLTRNGIEVLRYDDRGVGGSTANPTQATTADFATDALAAIGFLKKRPEVDGKKVGLLGHSEGGIVAPLAASRSTDVAFVVMVSGIGVTGERILLDQGALIAKAEGASDADVAKAADFQKRGFAVTRTGEGFDKLKADARKEVLDQLATLPESQKKTIGDPGAYADMAIEGQMAMLRSPWFKYFLDYDPAPTLEKVRCPVLALFGSLDLQVPADSNHKAVEAALARGGNKDLTVKVFQGANHLYQQAKTGSPSEYALLPKQFVPGFLDTITGWIRSKTGLGPVAYPEPKGSAAAAAALPDASPAAPPAPGSLEADAESFLHLLLNGKFAEAAGRFDPDMKAAMTAAALEASWKQATGEAGDFRAVTKRRTENGPNGMTVVDLTSAFERGRHLVRVVLDRDRRVSGLWIRPAEAL